MRKIIYSVQFHTYWHIGSGLSGGTGTNALVLKDDDGLPYIPGRALKGLLREGGEAMSSMSFIPDGFVGKVFGTKPEEESNASYSNYDLAYGCFFGNAELSAHLKQSLSQTAKATYLYENIASTAIGKNGQAKDFTLRRMEVSIPLILYGYIENFPDGAENEEALKRCFQWVKRMGVNRNRGLGRCSLQLKTN
ncbi:RAMP superfamily CRISPR-associated protein [Phaeodactylibacter xiamenensis]|uniref:RAMP superfamily CRISPR-associated protein n=1 Tax=Phaeodactylibacter xiamenensis TaxID=1524460 RepID=UPI0024A9E0AA|nr:RAMP superfamily CRISPR-associated protein [Phaeodactylibacter xiamenensis]